MVRTFTPRSVENLRPFLRAESHRLIDGFLHLGQCDFVEAFARQLPSAGLCELIGVPAEDRSRFMGWAGAIGMGFNVILLPTKINEVDRALLSLLEYADELIARRRADPGDDLVTRLAQAVDAEKGIPRELVRGSVAGLVFAGHETTKNQLGWMVAVLSDVPEEWDRVAKEPGRARAVIEEVLRFRSTATSFGRLALGAALARGELQEALIALSQRMHCPRLEPGVQFHPIGINGPTALPISYDAR